MSKPKLIQPSKALATKINYVNIDVTNDDHEQKNTQVVHAFKIDNLGLILESDTISELLTNLSVCSLPNTNQVLYGMGNLRGNIIPVFDLRTLFAMDESDYKYYLVIGEGSDAVAVLLDEVPIQIELNEDDKLNALPPIPSVLRPHVKDAFHSNGIWLSCNLMSFFESLSDHIK